MSPVEEEKAIAVEQPAQIETVVLEVGDTDSDDKKAQLKAKSQSS